jgi:starch phosphorylase
MTKSSRKWPVSFKMNTVEALKTSIMSNLEYRLAKDQYSATGYDLFLSTAYAVLERLVERWIATQQTYHRMNAKRVYYLSMEFLLGRSLENSLINLGLYQACQDTLEQLGLDLEAIRRYEVDAGLGNGGLGRLAACFLDSMATMALPAQGYGLRYEFGLFNQRFSNGVQVETPDNWLALPNPWEIERPEYCFKVRFGGKVEHTKDPFGQVDTVWSGGQEVLAMPFDTPVPGYAVDNVNTLRLWSSKATEEFDLADFNMGDYMAACANKLFSENITKVLYPNDNFFEGKELRLKQEFFLISASLQDIIRRFKVENTDIETLPDKVAIQLNDTHPALAIPELMRILIDEEKLDFKRAWDICVRTFGYTNHTVLPEALEEWPVDLVGDLLPRHLEIIYMINQNFIEEVAGRFPGDPDRLRRMSIIAEEGERRVRMAYLATIGSHSVNGVAELHSRLIRETILKDFYELWPGKFNNKTNGVTPRRWMRVSNPGLSGLITEAIGEGWICDLDRLRELERFADDASFQDKWRDIKLQCKKRLADSVWNQEWIEIHPDSMVDVQVKRMHEYKRQLLFALCIIGMYIRIKENPPLRTSPLTCIVGGKAAPGYQKAKLIVRLINAIAETVNKDPETSSFLRVFFLPNYRVSLAERLIPATDLSEQISTAGKEASGTGNMKFALNGAVTIGTLDGANIEILEEVGHDNMFIFGLNADEVSHLRSSGYNPRDYIERSALLKEVLGLLGSGVFSSSEPGLFKSLYEELTRRDEYFLMADFDSYFSAHEQAIQAYQDKKRWTRMSILNVARCGKFSSDRTIGQYAEQIWKVDPVHVSISSRTP